MFINTTFSDNSASYYPFAITPPVSLTQHVLPEQDADILLINCLDARHILFTCFADNSRKIDVTCCNIEPIANARKVLLYTLLIDDESNKNIDSIWNIYYHWKIDKNSLELLESQSDKLLRLSESIDQWHNSVYGSNIRFCDEESLLAVRDYWSGFTSTGLTSSQKLDREDRLQTAINRAKDIRQARETESQYLTGFCSALITAPIKRAREDVNNATKTWWDCGYMPLSNSSPKKYTHLNAAFLYSPYNQLCMYLGSSPLSGFPLSTAYVSISKQSPFSLDKSESPTEHLGNCAKSHFEEWASAFRKAVANGSVLRMFSGDALAFCLTLRNCQMTHSTSMNLPCHDQTYRPLILHHGDYGRNKNAPLSFDVIDAHFVERWGLLNVLALGSSLLKHHVSSCLYTELIVRPCIDQKLVLTTYLGEDVRSTCLLFGLCPPEQFTIATLEYSIRQGYMRVCWKRLAGSHTCGAPPYFKMEANQLAKLLINVFENMFKNDDPSKACIMNWEEESKKIVFQPYNHASFAFILSVIKTNIISDWGECLKVMYNKIVPDNLSRSNHVPFVQDLIFNLYVFGVDNSLFTKVDAAVVDVLILSFFAKFQNLPDQLCVTIRVPKEQIVFEARFLYRPFICSFEGMDSDGKLRYHSFSSVQTGFGKWSEQTEENNLRPYIEEDRSGMWGTSDMFFSVMVPTSMLISMLLQSNQFVPLVKCGVNDAFCSQTRFFKKLDPVQLFACSEITDEDVFISKFMPRMSGLPKCNIAGSKQQSTSDTTHVNLAEEGCMISTLVKRVNMESEAAKTKLADKSSAVKVKFKSPLTVIISIAGSLEFKLHFPVPVSTVSPKVRIARTSSYVEVEAEILDPQKVAPNFYSAFYFPFFLTKLRGGHVPVPWTSARVNPNVLPALNLDGSQGLPGEFTYSWLHRHLSHVYSSRELKEIELRPGVTMRKSYFKQGFFNIFRYSAGGLKDQKKMKPFWIAWENDRFHTLVFPSSIRLDLVNNTVILDCALIPITKAADKDLLFGFLSAEVNLNGSYQITNSDMCHSAWKSLMPALVERCRTWEHTPKCEYLKAGEVPLSKALSDDKVSPICSCGIGKFPKGYLKSKREKFPSLKYVLKRYATRAVISPIFPVPFVEECNLTLIRYQIEFCENCSVSGRLDADDELTYLLVCPKCKKAKYCSSDCQKAHWNEHKKLCKAG